MHIDNITASIELMNVKELDRIQKALDRRRRQLDDLADYRPVSTVVERRSYRHGVLQLERRAYRRKDGGLTERGPYWYFHYREGGQQKTLYLGKTDDPQGTVDEKLGKE